MRQMKDDCATALAAAPEMAAAPVDSADPAEYRKALGCFATGVTVVTARHQGQDWAMTCNSFSSVSLEPRLVLWSIRREAASHAAFTRSGGFSVSVLAQSQQPLARQFSTGSMAERLAGVPVHRLASGRLRLDGVVAWFDCDLHQMVEAGDHHILLGAVRHYGWCEQPALGYHRSRFGTFVPD